MEIKKIGDKIAEARKRTNISQAQLAQQLFISAQAVGKWERGESLPDIIALNRLAKIVGVDLNYFSDDFPSTVSEAASPPPAAGQPADWNPLHTANGSSAKQKSKPSWDMSRGNWDGADFSGLKNLHEKFSSSNLQRCLFVGSDLSGLHLKGNHVENCDFSASNFGGSHIQKSYLSHNRFHECSLKETEFSGSFLYGCDFTGADFTGVVIRLGGFTGVVDKSGGLEKNRIEKAVWNRTSFIDTQLADLVFSGKVEDCIFENCDFTRVTFHQALLVNTFFKCRSLKKIKFIDCQADRMTYEFLKNGKADLSGITLLKTI